MWKLASSSSFRTETPIPPYSSSFSLLAGQYCTHITWNLLDLLDRSSCNVFQRNLKSSFARKRKNYEDFNSNLINFFHRNYRTKRRKGRFKESISVLLSIFQSESLISKFTQFYFIDWLFSSNNDKLSSSLK